MEHLLIIYEHATVKKMTLFTYMYCLANCVSSRYYTAVFKSVRILVTGVRRARKGMLLYGLVIEQSQIAPV